LGVAIELISDLEELGMTGEIPEIDAEVLALTLDVFDAEIDTDC
jgi:hypothetical protein